MGHTLTQTPVTVTRLNTIFLFCTTMVTHSRIERYSAILAGHIRDRISAYCKKHTETIDLDKFLRDELHLTPEIMHKVQHAPIPSLLYSEPSKSRDLVKIKEDQFVELANELSAWVKEVVSPDDAMMIVFVNASSKFPEDHPAGTKARPDVVALKAENPDAATQSLKVDKSLLQWAGLESVMESQSSHTTEDASILQALAYMYYSLQARPDRHCLVGLQFNDEGFVFLAIDATGCKKTKRLSWRRDPQYTQLLLTAFIYILYKPNPLMVDETVVRTTVEGRVHFYFPGLDFGDAMLQPYYRVHHAGYLFGARSTVFKRARKSPPGKIKGKSADFIKEQYKRPGRRFIEPEVIDHIHKDGDVPGVVRLLDWHLAGEAKLAKFRLVEQDHGPFLIDAPTPRELLIGSLYDLIESKSSVYFHTCLVSW